MILYLAHVVPDARHKDVSVGKQDGNYHVQAYVDVVDVETILMWTASTIDGIICDLKINASNAELNQLF